MAIKGYSILLRSPQLIPHHQMQFSFMLLNLLFEGSYPFCKEYSQHILTSIDRANTLLSIYVFTQRLHYRHSEMQRKFFKQNTTGLKWVFFSYISCHTKVKEPVCSTIYPYPGGAKMNPCLFRGYYQESEMQTGFELWSSCLFPMLIMFSVPSMYVCL